MIVVGCDSTTVRLAEELVRGGEQVLVLVAQTEPDRRVVTELRELDVELVLVSRVREPDLVRAGVRTAKAVVILGADDVSTVRIALAVEELNHSVRIVLEMANPNLGDKLVPLLGECVALSSAELAAPSFVAAALATADTQTFELAGRLVAVGPRSRIGGQQLAVIGDSRRPGLEAVLPDTEGDIVLGTAVLGSGRTTVRRSGIFGALGHVFDRRVRVVLTGLLVLILLSTLYFHSVGTSWVVALFLALTTSTDTGDADLGDLSLPFQFGAVAIQLFGLVLSAGVTAVIVDALISSRLAAVTGSVRGRPRHHVVVCGLGQIGTLIAIRLRERGVPVVAIEQHEEAVGVLRVRAAKIPVVIAPATSAAAQEAAGIARADAVVAATDDEAVNLEIGLVAKHANPGVRVVTRLYDHDLAARVERRLELGATRSVSMLAAPAFAAAALDRRREVIFPVGRRVLLFTEIAVAEGSSALGRTVGDLEESGACRVLAHQVGGTGPWSWDPAATTVHGGDRLALVATRGGLARLLRTTKSTGPPLRTASA